MEKETNSIWKTRTLVAGTLIGALIGLGAAFLMTRRAEQEGTELTITTGKGLKMGMLVVGLLRSIMNLGDD